ncbi:MAG: hypothetical protein ACXWP5_16810 [Bdellovibrionota bacterium]
MFKSVQKYRVRFAALTLLSGAIALPLIAGAEETFSHEHFQKGKSRPSGGSSPLLTFRGGTVLHGQRAQAIFWGPQWSDPAFAGDKISGIDDFFNGYSGSSYANTVSEYTDASGAIAPGLVYLGHSVDSSSPPSKALSTSGAVAEACKITGNAPDPEALYLIYTSSGAGHVNYCAWHSWGTCSNGAQIQVAYMPNIDGISGCDPQDALSGHSQGLAALANVTAHELSETITDPRGAGWVDSSGSENGDKCAWAFPSTLSSFSNGTMWKLQMEWSNAAYSAGTGLPNLSGQKGCIF